MLLQTRKLSTHFLSDCNMGSGKTGGEGSEGRGQVETEGGTGVGDGYGRGAAGMGERRVQSHDMLERDVWSHSAVSSESMMGNSAVSSGIHHGQKGKAVWACEADLVKAAVASEFMMGFGVEADASEYTRAAPIARIRANPS